MLGYSSPAFVYIVIVLVLVLALRFLFFAFNYTQTKLFTIISKNIAFKIRENVLNHLSRRDA